MFTSLKMIIQLNYNNLNEVVYAYYFKICFTGKMFGLVSDADILRQVRPTGISSHGVRLCHGRSSEQHN